MGLPSGDALGVSYEFRPRGTFECTDMIGYGTHEAARRHLERRHICGARHLRLHQKLGRVTPRTRDKFVSWIANGRYTIDGVFDYGGTTARAPSLRQGGSGERDSSSARSCASHLAFCGTANRRV